ncbi:DUF1573 domain-containing protein [Pontiellaceae bacterium B1224]|nr:DUF1573 domain-containing protein [Pontiellaceae bacterium B1224]
MKLLITILLLSMSATAALKWEQQTQHLKVHPTQLTAVAEFHGSNVGETPVTISKIEMRCGCLVPKIAKKTIDPGEQCVLPIVFDLRGRHGPQEKKVLVKTDDGNEVRLSIKTDIPTSYNVVPKLMKWTADNPVPEKTAILTNPNAFPIQLTSVVSSNESITAELKVVRAGFEYEIRVPRPVAGKNVRSVIRVKTEPFPGESESKDLKLYVMAE